MINNPYFMVLGMCLVTYLPRVIPFLFVQQIQLPRFVERFLRYIPFAALGTLAFPQIFFSVGKENVWATTIATIVCMVFAWFRINVVMIVLIAIAVVYGCTKIPLSI